LTRADGKAFRSYRNHKVSAYQFSAPGFKNLIKYQRLSTCDISFRKDKGFRKNGIK
ncbi:hypothetical protein L9F63_005483, partial [Diploptera punctata]